MKPFNLEDALAGKAVKLRDGTKAYVRHHETEHLTEIDEVLLGYREGVCSWSWCADGESRSTGGESPFDIIGMYPETRIINGFEVPAPEVQAPKYDSNYYAVSVNECELYTEYFWYGDIFDFRMLERGLVFLNKEDAIATAKAMLSIDPNSGG